MKPHASDWLDLSAYDLDVAKDMLKSQRYVYTVFMCHLSTEKLLKAAIVEFTEYDPPPKIHILKRLAEIAGLTPTDEQLRFLVELTDQQQRSRYPEDIAALGRIYTRAYANRILKQTKDFRRWLEPKIKSGPPSGNLSKH
ncbi:MAG TPA: HEPN domain-containing protein [Anaerolineae bacterium]|nr:HEPN domain-containing protein [Anaerolineae bacterium]